MIVFGAFLLCRFVVGAQGNLLLFTMMMLLNKEVRFGEEAGSNRAAVGQIQCPCALLLLTLSDLQRPVVNLSLSVCAR